MTLKITSAQEAAFNAAGEAMVDLGLIASLNYDSRNAYETPFMFIAKVGEDYAAGSGTTPALAFAKFAQRAAEQAAEEQANPKLATAAAVKKAAKALIEEAREHAAINGPTKVKLDEIADRIDALQVKA